MKKRNTHAQPDDVESIKCLARVITSPRGRFTVEGRPNTRMRVECSATLVVCLFPSKTLASNLQTWKASGKQNIAVMLGRPTLVAIFSFIFLPSFYG